MLDVLANDFTFIISCILKNSLNVFRSSSHNAISHCRFVFPFINIRHEPQSNPILRTSSTNERESDAEITIEDLFPPGNSQVLSRTLATFRIRLIIQRRDIYMKIPPAKSSSTSIRCCTLHRLHHLTNQNRFKDIPGFFCLQIFDSLM